MSRPQIVVTITEVLARRGNLSPTGAAFFAYAGATGPTDAPVKCTSPVEATAAGVPATVAAWVGDCLTAGAPSVTVVRAAAVDATAVTQPEWKVALDKLTAEDGIGQVLIPGVDTPAAYTALLEHSATTGRTVLLDTSAAPSAATLATAAAGLGAADGADRCGVFGPWLPVPAGVGVTRDVPGAVIAAGLAARGDARVGHSNHAPAGTHSGGAGVVARALGVTKVFTDTEVDALYDAGVNVFRVIQGRPTLMGWRSVSDSDLFKQLNAGRLAMEIGSRVRGLGDQFLFRQIDGRGHLYAELEGALRGYLLDLWTANALYGETADDAFDVDVQNVNSAETAAAGELLAAVEARLTRHTEKVLFTVRIALPEGATA